MLRIAVCDSEEDIARAMRIRVKERLPSCEIQVFTSWDALLEKRESFDIAFLDISSLSNMADENELCRISDSGDNILKKESQTLDAESVQQLFIKTRYKSSAIDVADIYYLENEGRKIAAHTQHETIEFYAVMTELEGKLGKEFFRCHRGYLVNLKHVVRYDTRNIWLRNGEVIYLAKGRYQEFERRYKEFLTRKNSGN